MIERHHRRRLSLLISSLLLPILLVACQSTPTTIAQRRADAVSELGGWMTGTFSSHAQSLAEPDDFFDIRLVMIPIWTDRADGPWLYVEQAVAEMAERPYRQRVYQLVGDNAGVRTNVFTLPGDPLDYAAAWNTPNPLGDITPDDLALRDGCSIELARRSDGAYAGSTVGDGCESTLRGAAYATSEVMVNAHRLVSWDQGWDDAGNQVWGPTRGAYVFEKVSGGVPE